MGQVILDFVLDVLELCGHLPDESLNAACQVALDDAALVEIISWVGPNSDSNWVNNLIQPTIDFPEVLLID